MANIYSKYDTGSDTTGVGTVANPYKTLGKSISVMSNGDACGLLADEVVSGAIAFPSYSDYTKHNIIFGANAAGVADGTRRQISGNGAIANFGTFATASYPWNFIGINFYNFTDYIFSGSVATMTVNLINSKVDTAKGLFSSTAFRSGILLDFEAVNLVTTGSTTSMNLYAYMAKRCKFINCSVATGSFLTGSTGGLTLLDCIFKGCVSTTGALVSSISVANDLIIDNCSQPTSTINSLLTMLGGCYIGRVLITNCVGNTGATAAIIKFIGNGSANVGSDIAFWNNSNWLNKISTGATTKGITLNAPIDLPESPYADADTLRLSPTYLYRRVPVKIGEFNYSPVVI